MTEEKQKSLIYQDGIYVGKIWKKDFPPDEQGNIAKSYQYQFQVGDKVWNFWGYGTTKGVDKLIEGNTVTIGYVTKDIGDDRIIKQARFFGEPREQKTDQPAPEKQSSLPTEPQITATDLTGLLKDYRAACKAKDKEPDLTTFIGAAMRISGRDKDFVAQLTKAYEAKDTPTEQFDPIKLVQSKIKELGKENGVDVQTLVSEKLPEALVNKAIERLSKSGDIYQVSNGKWRVLE